MEQLKLIQTWLRVRVSEIRQWWAQLSIGQQRRVLVWLFTSYTCLSAVVVIKACYDFGKNTRPADIRHIENPTLKKKELPQADSLTNRLKDPFYGN